jgi:hypothetical protein
MVVKNELNMKIPRDRSPFFFIHTYKNLGTTVIYQLSKEYRVRFFGNKTLETWEIENEELLNHEAKEKFKHKNMMSIDHMKIDDTLELGILDEWDMSNRKFLSIVREPIDRFLSMCNYLKIHPKKMASYLQPWHKQISSFECSKPIDITLILMENPKLIEQWFEQFDIKIKLDKKVNSSNKQFYIDDICEYDLEKISKFFEDDFKLYEKLKNKLD